MDYLLILLLVVVTVIFGKVGRWFGLSEVVGQLFAGIVLGTSLLNIVQPSNLIHLSAEIGIFLLMFHSGLESDLKEMKKHIKASTLIAMMGVLLPAIAFPISFLMIGYSLQVSVFAGIVFSATSISITLAVLSEQDKLATPTGAIILSAAVLDDIIALIAVTLFSIFVGVETFRLTSLLPLFAFLFGMFVRKFNVSHQVATISTKLGKWFFYPIFFGSIALELVVQGLNNKVGLILIMSILAILTKFFGSYIGARLSGIGVHIASAIGAGMISRGEMALVIIQIGISSQIINDNISAEFIVTVIISTMAAPIIMKPLFNKI